jgi:hypothetical protein
MTITNVCLRVADVQDTEFLIVRIELLARNPPYE